MILKILLFVSTILSFWPPVARCESDGLSELREKKISVTSVPAVELVEGANKNNDRINHVKPLVNNVDMSAKDYQKFRVEAHRLNGPMDSLRSKVNVNVNHHGFSKLPWDKYPLERLHRQQNLHGRTHRQLENNRIFDIFQMLPNANIDHHVLRPQNDIVTGIKKYPSHKTVETLRRDSNELASIEEKNDNQCRPIVHQALEYLRRVDINLRNLGRDLRSLIVRS